MEKERDTTAPEAKEEWERILDEVLEEDDLSARPDPQAEPGMWDFENFSLDGDAEQTESFEDYKVEEKLVFNEEPELPPVRREPRPRPERRSTQTHGAASAHGKPRTRTDSNPASGHGTRPAKKKGKPDKFRKFRKNRFWLLGFLWLTFVYSSVIVRMASEKTMFFKPGLFLCLLFALTPAILFFVLFTICKKPKVNRALITVFTAIIYVLYASQLIYYKVFAQYYTFSSMGNADQGFGFMSAIFATIGKNIICLVFLAAPLLFIIFFGKKFFSFKGGATLGSSVFMLILMAVWHVITVLILPLWGTGSMTPYDMYHYTYDVKDSAAQLGLGTAFRLDAKWTIFKTGKTPGLDLDLSDPDEDSTEGTLGSGESQPDGTAPSDTTAPQQQGDNVIEGLDLEALAAAEGDSDIRDMHLYFNSMKPTNKNEKTGMFKGCNLIMLTAEGFSHLAIDPELTPTLYKIQTQGFNFTNFYTPIWGVSTSDGEYAALTGTIPKAGVWSFSTTGKQKNYMPLTMCAQLKDLGYTAYGYHNHDYKYYDREYSHPNMGYIWKGVGNGLEEGVTKQWPESDIEMIDFTTPEYMNKEPFHAYYMTVSGHLLYNWNNSMAVKNRDLVKDLPYSETVKAYLACQIELDRALGLLLQRLEEAGVAENTVIALTADHYPYGLTAEEQSELAGHPIDTTFEMYRNACFIYKPGMTPETVDELACSMDFLPTLSNLFGIEYDSRLYIGHDIFSDADPLVIFKDRSWLTDKASYDANTGKVESLTGEEVSDDYVNKIKKSVSNKFSVSANILDMDYWGILFKDEREQQ